MVDNLKAAGMRVWAWELSLDMLEMSTIGTDFSPKQARGMHWIFPALVQETNMPMG